MSWRDHITADPTVLAGKPILKGTRLSVELILGRLADGWSQDDLLASYPTLTPVALQAVFAFATEMVREEEFVALAKIGA
jgi:uncharacterized protein (DUF433 family)